MKSKRKQKRNKKTIRIRGINSCPSCMKTGHDVRLALETRNLIKAIQKSPFHSLFTIGNEILGLPNFKKQKKYIDRLEKQLCHYLNKISFIC